MTTNSETYARARARLLAELAARGWETAPDLKVPWARHQSPHATVWFKPQAVWASGSTTIKFAHSLWVDIRMMPVDDFIAAVLAHADQDHRELGGGL